MYTLLPWRLLAVPATPMFTWGPLKIPKLYHHVPFLSEGQTPGEGRLPRSKVDCANILSTLMEKKTFHLGACFNVKLIQ